LHVVKRLARMSSSTPSGVNKAGRVVSNDYSSHGEVMSVDQAGLGFIGELVFDNPDKFITYARTTSTSGRVVMERQEQPIEGISELTALTVMLDADELMKVANYKGVVHHEKMAPPHRPPPPRLLDYRGDPEAGVTAFTFTVVWDAPKPSTRFPTMVDKVRLEWCVGQGGSNMAESPHSLEDNDTDICALSAATTTSSSEAADVGSDSGQAHDWRFKEFSGLEPGRRLLLNDLKSNEHYLVRTVHHNSFGWSVPSYSLSVKTKELNFPDSTST